MSLVEDQFAQAIDHHQNGRLDQAEAAYGVILAEHPDHADSLHLLGVIACQQGRHAEAVGLIERAIAIKDGAAAFYSNLGVALRELERGEEAEAAFRKALALSPDYAEAWCNLATVLEEQGYFEESEAACRRALALRPNYPEAHLNLGGALKGQKRYAEAAECYRQAIALTPRYAKAHSGLGVVLKELGEADLALQSFGRSLMIDPAAPETHLNLSNLLRAHNRFEEALGAAEETLRLKPGSPLALLCLGNALDALGRYEEAVDAFAQAIALKPDFAEAHSNMGNALKEAGRLEEAEAACRTAIALKPGNAMAHSNLGNVFKERNDLPQALACYGRAVECDADFAQGHLNRGIAHLLQGEMDKGWPDYEWRWQFEDWPQKLRYAEYPRWSGDAANGRTMLVWPEQGMGDMIHFCRYLPRLVQDGWKVIVEAPEPLVRLFSGIEGLRVVPFGSIILSFDVQCPMMSLAGLIPGIPDRVPYLSADPKATEVWRQRLAALPGRKVGFAWRGNPQLRRDRHRSLPAEAFAALMKLPGIIPVILQKDVRDDELAALDLQGPHLVAGPELVDFHDSAALMNGLDLVVGVDTSVVHLAGALNRPVFTLIEFAPDWRWQLGRQDCLWYPSMRLFRQQEPGQWEAPLRQLRQALLP
jgi:tetratricopeptide (TPR) repeat protein